MLAIHTKIVPWREWPQWAPSYAKLLERSGIVSVFLTPEWISEWLAVYGETLEPDLLFFFEGRPLDPIREAPVGGCLVVRRQRKMVRTIHLNCDGEDEADSTYIEYNHLVALPAQQAAVALALAAYFQRQEWDRLIISGAGEQSALDCVTAELGRTEVESRPCHFVDLKHLREHGRPYADVISGNTRKQNKFTQRQFERILGGECQLEFAKTPDEMRAYLLQLAELHNATWRARGKQGLFGSERFVAFHQKLISKLGPRGEVLLIRLRCADRAVAVLYCLLHQRRVYFYQSGIDYGIDKRLRPGFLTLTLAIEALRERADIDEFDFLAGDAQYKRSLGPQKRKLRWITVWSPSLTSGALQKLRRLRNVVGSWSD